MKVFIHVIRKDVGGPLDLLEGLLALLWEIGMGKGACGAVGSLCEGRLGPFASLCFLFLAKGQDCACQCEDAICTAQPARLLQNCTRINMKS